jgi:hypothetical protein
VKKAGHRPGFCMLRLHAPTPAVIDRRLTITTKHDLMLRSVLARLEYWSAQAADAKRANDSEREALCRRSIDEYNILIATIVETAVQFASSENQSAPAAGASES